MSSGDVRTDAVSCRPQATVPLAVAQTTHVHGLADVVQNE